MPQKRHRQQRILLRWDDDNNITAYWLYTVKCHSCHAVFPCGVKTDNEVEEIKGRKCFYCESENLEWVKGWADVDDGDE